ncbi:MAG: hypothetical protein AB2417_01085 [Clostridiaceae bacterium]
MGKKKGKHEASVEFAKELLEEGTGMEEIVERTGLNHSQIKKVMLKMEKGVINNLK